MIWPGFFLYRTETLNSKETNLRIAVPNQAKCFFQIRQGLFGHIDAGKQQPFFLIRSCGTKGYAFHMRDVSLKFSEGGVHSLM